MRQNARSKGRWSKQQEVRRRRLRNLANDGLITNRSFEHLVQFNRIHERCIKLQHPKATRDAGKYREWVTALFLTVARDLEWTEQHRDRP